MTSHETPEADPEQERATLMAEIENIKKFLERFEGMQSLTPNQTKQLAPRKDRLQELEAQLAKLDK